MSGSRVATAATIGTVALPEIEQRKYDGKLSTGSLAAGDNLRIPGALADMVLAAPLTPVMVMVMLLVYAIYFFMGIFSDGISMMIITLPVIFPWLSHLATIRCGSGWPLSSSWRSVC